MSHMMGSKALLCLLVGTAVALVACDEETGGDPTGDAGSANRDAGDSTDDAGAPTGDAGDPLVFSSADVITGATPGVDRVRLDASHEGWGRASCPECHGTWHASNYAVGDCVTCHGVNGAPLRSAGHADRGCRDCHLDRHSDLLLGGDDPCRACHGLLPDASGCAYQESYDVVIIGGGGGGLAAAAKLVKSGLSVLLVEQHYKVGGCMVMFPRGEYRFEASLHAYDGWGVVYLMALGIEGELVRKRGDVMYRLIYPDMTFDVPADKEAYRDALKTVFPDEAAPLDELFADFGIGGLGRFDGLSLLDAVVAYGIENERLIDIFTVLSGFLAATPGELPAEEFMGMWESYHKMGYYYFEGGSQSVTDALEAAITAGGGVIKRHTRANRITTAGGRATGITTDDGGCYVANSVISNAGARTTLLEMVGREQLPEEAVAELERRRPAVSNLGIIFLGVDKDYTDLFPGGTHEMIVAGDDRVIFDGINEVACQPEGVSFIITDYSAVDPLAAPPGKNAIVITVDFMDYECGNEWNWGVSYDSYEAYKSVLADVIVARAEALLPDLAEHVEVMEVASPRTVEQFTLSEKGSWAGWDFEPGSDHVYTDTIQTPIEGLYLVGAWTGGAGQSLALSSGIQAAEAVTQELNGE